jgi:hypothetical protein
MSARIEATIPDQRAEQVKQLEQELGLSKSQLVDEGLAILAKAVAETRQGRRLGFVGKDQKVTEFTSPTLSLVEWAIEREPLKLSGAAFEQVKGLIERPPAPNAALSKAMAARRARKR